MLPKLKKKKKRRKEKERKGGKKEERMEERTGEVIKSDRIHVILCGEQRIGEDEPFEQSHE